MKRLYFILSTLALLVAARQTVHATNSVKITTNGNTSSETHVRIETNGEVKSFDTKGDQDVDWTSEDGQSSVKIDSTTGNNTPTPTTSSRTQIKTNINVKQNSSNDNNSDDKLTPTKTEHKVTQTKSSFSLSDLFKNLFDFIFGKK